MQPESRSSRIASFAAAVALVASAARAQLTPEWITAFPVGNSWYSGIGAMTVDANGVTYVTGGNGSSSNADIVTTAIRTDGTILWTRTWDGPASWHDQARGIALAPGGVLYVCGNTPDAMSYANVLLLKYDAATGTLLNTVVYSSGPGTSEYANSVAVDAQGGVYLGGGTVGDGTDGLILKYDAAGVRQWTRVWDGPAQAPYSGDRVLMMRVSPTGEPIALIHGEMSTLHPDYVVLELAPADGAVQWEATWGGPTGDFPTDIEIDAAGDVYVTGTAGDFAKKYSTIKLRGNDGQLVWQAYDTAGARDVAKALTLDAQGGVYVTGAADPDGDVSNFNENFFTVKRDAATGALRWAHLYGLNCVGCYDAPSDVAVDAAGHAFVAGITSSAPYSNDTLTFVLDATTGVELERGVVANTAPQPVRPGFLRFDAAFDLYDGGVRYDANTGGYEITVFKYAALAAPPGVPYCFGDGSGAACPCANESAPGSLAGCGNSLGTGARLTVSGVPSLSNDTLVLAAAQMPNSSALFIQGTAQLVGGAGATFGDGLRCAGGSVVRLGAKLNASGASQYPTFGDAPISVRGLVAATGARTYQVWYRNAAAFCTASTFNLSNGITVTWRP